MQLSLFDFFSKLRTEFNKKKSNKTTYKKKNSYKKKKRLKFSNDPFLKNQWISIRKEYFPNQAQLDNYTVYWSNRNQIRTLASCNIHQKKIRVARELNYPKYNQFLEPLLYHEMCHASLGFSIKNQKGKTAWHGKEFKALENRHPKIKDLDIWIKSGGWSTAVRSDRTKRYHQQKKMTVNE